MKKVKMLKSYKSLNPGELAGFEDYEADHLIKQGAAQLVEEAPKAAEEAPKKADKKADKPADKVEG